MSWPKLGRLVLVEWIDSNSTSGWQDPETMRGTVERSMLCKSVGWLFFDGPDRICLIPNQAECESVSAAITIPRMAVVSITDLHADGGPADGRPEPDRRGA